MHGELGDDEVLREVEVAQRRPRFVDLLAAVDAVAMQQRDVRAIRGALGPENGLTKTSQVTVRVVHDEEHAGIRGDPPRGSRDAQAKRWQRRGHRAQALEVGRLVDDGQVRLHRGGLLRIVLPRVDDRRGQVFEIPVERQ